MSSELNSLRYLTPADDSFWEWGDDGEVVVFRGGVTLAYRVQVAWALGHFKDRGLPPLELVLLILLSCRDNWSAMKEVVRTSLENNSRPTVSRPIMKQWWDTLFQGLDRVHGLPQQMRASPAAHRTIIEIALERLHHSTVNNSEVHNILARAHWLRIWTLPDPLIAPIGERTQQFSAMSHGLLKLSVDEVLTRTSTGLNEVPEPPEEVAELIEVPEALESRTVSQLLEELRNDDEHRELVRLVRMLSAVLTLPRDLSTPEELSQGGVSDITNRGPLDRLLLSELANDDDTLMTRVALNEALYLRRESPPSHPVRDRVLLIDVGIRMWGLPRLCATVVGLSLAAQTPAGSAARVFCVGRKGGQLVDFTTREGLVEQLAMLSYEAHPGEWLSTWLEEADQENADVATDRIIITGEDVLADPAFRRDLRTHNVLPAYIVTVNRAGRVRLIRETATGEKQLRELWLDLDGITGARQHPEKPLIDKSVDPRLPAILRLPRFPLRLSPLTDDSDSVAQYPKRNGQGFDLVQATRDRRLLLWDQATLGGRQLTDRLPPGQLRWSGDLMHDGSFSLVFTKQDGRVHLVHVEEDATGLAECRVVALHFWNSEDANSHIYAVCAHSGVLLFILKTTVIAVDPVSGLRLESTRFPDGMGWKRDRYFHQHYGLWHSVSFAEGKIRFDLFFEAKNLNFCDERVLGIVGPPDDLAAVLSGGELYNIKTKQFERIVGDGRWSGAQLESVSPDGTRFAVRGIKGSTEREQQDVVTIGTPCTTIHRYYSRLNPVTCGDPGLPNNVTLIKNVRHLSYGKHLMLVTKKGRRVTLDLPSARNGVMFLRGSTAADGPYQDTPSFVEIPAPKGVGYTLQQVTWSGGSRAVLDSRGLLHLQSSDPAIPEVTLVLYESHLSGWCSTGEVWGRDFFLDESAPQTRRIRPDQAMQYIRRFLERLP